MASDKVQLRKHYRLRRDLFKEQADEFIRASERLSIHIKQFLAEIPKGSLVFGYRAYKSEAPLPWVDAFRWAFPRIKGNGEMNFFEAQNHSEGFEPNAFGIPEPASQPHALSQAKEAKAILVPALCFDGEGYRLGAGKGFYDRFLAPLKGVLKVGIGFHVQLHKDPLPRDPWDLPMDWLITDRNIVGFSRRK